MTQGQIGDGGGSDNLVRRGDGSPLPAFNARQMGEALTAYKELQHSLDAAMPDQIMDLDGKKFRKKGYWRAVAVAFNLTVETIEERREIAGHFGDGRPNFGYVVSKRATAPNGRSVVGDGACFAIEKARRFKCPHPEREGSRRTLHFPHTTCPDFDPEFQWRALSGDATEHNVRGHAATRAFNRAVSDLVGFGEVSAEEIDRDHEDGGEPKPAGRSATPAAQHQASGGTPSQPTTTAAPGTTYVKTIALKTGKSAKGEWRRRFVTFEDGRDGVTFSDTLADELEAARVAHTPVNPEIAKGEKGNDLKGLLPLVAAKPAEEVHPPDEPVAGPEKILTIREVTTDKGPRWIIQTEKRQLVTDQQAHADAAKTAREAKTGLVPIFETLATSAGNHANKLTGWASTEREPGAEG